MFRYGFDLLNRPCMTSFHNLQTLVYPLPGHLLKVSGATTFHNAHLTSVLLDMADQKVGQIFETIVYILS